MAIANSFMAGGGSDIISENLIEVLLRKLQAVGETSNDNHTLNPRDLKYCFP